MDEPITNITDNLTDAEWMIALYYLIVKINQDKNDTWKKYCNDLIYLNRFHSDSPIVEELRNRATRVTKIIPQNTILYRARLFKSNPFYKLYRHYLHKEGYTAENIEEILANTSDMEINEQVLSSFYSSIDINQLADKGEKDAFLSAHREWMQIETYKGYNAEESACPPPELAISGRANPDHIRYLYLCEDAETTIYEIRPIIGDTVSVAQFSLQREIKVYDLTLDIKDHMTNPDYEWPSLYNTIGQMFSRPNNGDLLQYIPTQYLAEEIKRMGFDGLRFNSSLHKGGVNIVLFDPDIYKAMSSELVDVAGIELKLDEPIIYKIGQAKQVQESAETKN